jgi:hypothetical protein
MPVNTKYRFLICPNLGSNYLNLDLDRRAARPKFSGRLSRNFCMRSHGMFGARLPA